MPALLSPETFRDLLNRSRNIVFFGGAGVSTESGIPDFRSVDGLYRQKWEYPPETILSREFFIRRPEDFYRFYREKLVFSGAKPNACHRWLAKNEATGKVKAVVTQNIDGLHQAAGSRNVLELHGSLLRNHCLSCGKAFSLDRLLARPGIVPRCDCGGIIRPDVVLYGEPLEEEILEAAADAVREADLLIVGGTSLTVYPAAGLLRRYRGNRLVLINRDPTPADDFADFIHHGPIGAFFARMDEKEPDR